MIFIILFFLVHTFPSISYLLSLSPKSSIFRFESLPYFYVLKVEYPFWCYYQIRAAIFYFRCFLANSSNTYDHRGWNIIFHQNRLSDYILIPYSYKLFKNIYSNKTGIFKTYFMILTAFENLIRILASICL